MQLLAWMTDILSLSDQTKTRSFFGSHKRGVNAPDVDSPVQPSSSLSARPFWTHPVTSSGKRSNSPSHLTLHLDESAPNFFFFPSLNS